MEEKVFESLAELKAFLESVPEGTIVNVCFEEQEGGSDDESL